MTSPLASSLSTALHQVAYSTDTRLKPEAQSLAAYDAYDHATTFRMVYSFDDTSGRYCYQMHQKNPRDIYCVIFDTHHRLDAEGIEQLEGGRSYHLFEQDVLGNTRHAKRIARLPGLPVGDVRLARDYASPGAKIYTPHAALDPAYQGRGLAGCLYRLALHQGAVLITAEHSPDAKRLWDKLAKLPGVTDAYAESRLRWVETDDRQSLWALRLLLGKGRSLDEVLQKLNARR